MTPKPSPPSDLQIRQAWEGSTVHALGNTKSLECLLSANTRARCFLRTFSPAPTPR